MTYIADLDPNNPLIAADEARHEWFDENFPGWEVREGYGDRFVGEGDFPVEPATVAGTPTVEDWEAFAEANWSDPAEIDY
jgi:hypothetical protein